MNFKALALGSVLALGTIFTPSAEAGVACGSRSFVIEHSRNDSYVMFHEGGRVTFNFDNGTRSRGTWYWSGNDAVVNHLGETNVWSNVRNLTCDSRY